MLMSADAHEQDASHRPARHAAPTDASGISDQVRNGSSMSGTAA
jgi:hypothetical protein